MVRAMMMMMMNKVPTKKCRVKMKKMIAIRLVIPSPRAKIWKWRLENSHYQIPSKGFEIPDCVKEKCKPVDSHDDGTWERLQGELESKCAVINSMEVAQNTMFELLKDKDELIASQKALIDVMHKVDADINSTRKKLGDVRDLIIHKDAELDKCKMEIIKLSENSTSPDGHLELEHQLE